jgi:chemotaxis protein methyltransferase CheR
LNLVQDVYPSLATDTNAMDVIFCRNVLMYFTPAQIGKVVGQLHRSLIDGGWLAVGPSEASQVLFPQFATINLPGVILYQKSDAPLRALPRTWTPAPTPVAPREHLRSAVPPRSARPTPLVVAASLFEQGHYSEAADIIIASFSERRPDHEAFSLVARALANQGKLADALAWCERWIAAEKMNAAGHYVRAAVLLEHGRPDDARRSLQRAVYLDSSFVLAHFMLGIVARQRGHDEEAARHFTNTLRLLRGLNPDDLLPESDGLTAGRLTETIAAMTGRVGDHV